MDETPLIAWRAGKVKTLEDIAVEIIVASLPASDIEVVPSGKWTRKAATLRRRLLEVLRVLSALYQATGAVEGSMVWQSAVADAEKLLGIKK